jgi:hypothetical protein
MRGQKRAVIVYRLSEVLDADFSKLSTEEVAAFVAKFRKPEPVPATH